MRLYYQYIPNPTGDIEHAMRTLADNVNDLSIDEFFPFDTDQGRAFFLFDEGYTDQTQNITNLLSRLFAAPENYLSGTAAIKEFFLQTIGLRSINAGAQVYGFRKSYTLSQKLELTGPVFRYLYHQSIWLSEKLRSESEFYTLACSYDRVLDEVARKIFGNDTRPTLSMIGDNTPFLEILAAFKEGHPDAHKDHGPVNQQIDTFRAGLITLLGNDYEQIIAHEEIIKTFNAGGGQPFLVIGDKPGLSFTNNVFYYSLDNLRSIASQTLEVRNKEAKKIYKLIDNAVRDYEEWVKSESRHKFLNIISKSQKMQQVFETVSKIAQTNITVLISGESGTGKELIAQALHKLSGRDPQKLIVVNAGAIPENLLESELFGHVRGAFTGAVSAKNGLFLDADGGTIFLDEIGELPQTLQVKLLRFLQSGEIRPVGSNQSLIVDVRVVAATNRDLMDMVKKGLFRSDLYYRLNVIPIHLPPLRQRKEDIPLLAAYFTRQCALRMGRDIGHISDKALQNLVQYNWPGNVRELENVIEHTVALASGKVVHDFDLPETITSQPPNTKKSLSLKELEREHILMILDKFNNNYDKACEALGISRTTLWRKLKLYGLQPSGGISD